MRSRHRTVRRSRDTLVKTRTTAIGDSKSLGSVNDLDVVLTFRREVCKCPPRGQVVQTNRAAVRRVPGHLKGVAATAGRPSVSGGSSMKVRFFAAAALAAVLAVAASTASARTSGANRAAASKITVWLQVDAQTGWPDLVAAANQQFRAKHPGATVDVQYQTWGDHLSKFDATLAGGNTPDVIEMGNTEMTKYSAAGAFQDLTAISFP